MSHSALAARPLPSPSLPPLAADVLIVPGLNGSCEDHWQSAWERERQDCRRADLGDWKDPTPEQWIQRLDEEISAYPSPVILVAHSLGCIAAAAWNAARPQAAREKIKAALLVAPCDPEAENACAPLKRFAPIPRAPFAARSILVASANDQYATLGRSKVMAKWWGSEFVNVGLAGHINARSNLGAWPFGQSLLAQLQC